MGKHKEIATKDWPYNVLDAIGLTYEDPLEFICSESELLLAMNTGFLTAREKQVIMLRYYHQNTLDVVGTIIGTQRERARQIEAKALRKLRHPTCCYILLHGAKAYVDKRVNEKIEEQLQYRKKELEAEYYQKISELKRENVEEAAEGNVMDMKILDLDLSLRPYNCLTRAGLKTVGDILRKCPTIHDAYSIRYLGRKSIEEISEKLGSLGIEWPKQVRSGE